MKKRLWLLSILAAIILCSFIVESYGLFETEGSAEGVFSVGKWVIEVNDVNITQTRTITLDVTRLESTDASINNVVKFFICTSYKTPRSFEIYLLSILCHLNLAFFKKLSDILFFIFMLDV